MQAKEQTLEQLLAEKRQFRVPLYQRTYSWQREQVEQLWNDIIGQADLISEGIDAPGHFCGSLVFSPTPMVIGRVQGVLVVDGQQRLTTLTVMLSALRDHLAIDDPQAIERINEQYLINKYADDSDRPKLLPTQGDRDAMQDVVAGRGQKAGGNIGETYRVVRDLLVKADDPEDPHDMLRIEQAITQRLDLVAITAEPNDNVHRIFQSLNNTGMQLSQGDLLRNHLFMLIPNHVDRLYEQVWLPLEDELGAANLELLGYVDLLANGNERANRGSMYQQQTERIRAFQADEAAVVADIERLAIRGHALAQVLHPHKVQDDALRVGIERLHDWGGEAAWPVVTVAVERLRDGTSTVEQVVNVLAYLESYLVRRMLCGKTASGINRAMAVAAHDLVTTDRIDDHLRQSMSAERRFWPTDNDLVEAILTRNFYWSGRKSQQLFVLRRLEESFGHNEKVDFKAAKPTIEHVLPQTLTDEWAIELNDPELADMGVDELHKLYVHRLGNLTLSSYNSALSNDSFAIKREIYKESNFELTRRLGQSEVWGVQQINDRARFLAEIASSLWPGPLREDSPQAVRDKWQTTRRILAVLPEGSWTSYGDICVVEGTAPQALGQFLATSRPANAWRVLDTSGRVSTIADAESGQASPRETLGAEGVKFSEDGLASQDQRLGAADLAELLGIEIPDQVPMPDDLKDAAKAERFWLQLSVRNDQQVFDAVQALLQDWMRLGGTLVFGQQSATTCFPILRRGDESTWPWSINPKASTLEVVFQHLKVRPPFDDIELRDRLRQHINKLDGVHIDAGRLGLRPAIPLTTALSPNNLERMLDVQRWFAAKVLPGV